MAERDRNEGVRWAVLRADAGNFFGRLPRMLRNDPTAVMLIVANLYPVVELLVKKEPIGSLLIVYWIQLMIIGFWNAVKLAVITRWKALVIVPMFVVMYVSIVNMFGLIAGGLLDNQMQGTAWHDNFSPAHYRVTAAIFFVNHGLSFWINFIRGREFETTTWETQLGKPFLRAMPMWLATLIGGIIGAFLNSAALALVFVLPVKLALDVFGHFVDNGMLGLDEDPAQPLWRK